VSVPPVPEKQLGEVVAIEARKYIPVPLNEVLLDWSIIPKKKATLRMKTHKTEKSGFDVLVVAIHNEYHKQLSGHNDGSGLNPSFYEIEIFSAIRAVARSGLSTNMIIDFGAALDQALHHRARHIASVAYHQQGQPGHKLSLCPKSPFQYRLPRPRL